MVCQLGINSCASNKNTSEDYVGRYDGNMIFPYFSLDVFKG